MWKLPSYVLNLSTCLAVLHPNYTVPLRIDGLITDYQPTIVTASTHYATSFQKKNLFYLSRSSTGWRRAGSPRTRRATPRRGTSGRSTGGRTCGSTPRPRSRSSPAARPRLVEWEDTRNNRRMAQIPEFTLLCWWLPPKNPSIEISGGKFEFPKFQIVLASGGLIGHQRAKCPSFYPN